MSENDNESASRQDQGDGGEELAEVSRLKDLTEAVRDQDDLERDIGRQADKLLLEQADQRDQRRIEKTLAEKEKLTSQIRRLRQRLSGNVGPSTAARIQAEIDSFDAQIAGLDADAVEIQGRIDERHRPGGGDLDSTLDVSGNKQLPNESRREYLIRTGKITPFSQIGRSVTRSASNLQDVMLNAEEKEDQEESTDDQDVYGDLANEPWSHRNLQQPGFSDIVEDSVSAADSRSDSRPSKRRRLVKASDDRAHYIGSSESDKQYDDADIGSRESSSDQVDLDDLGAASTTNRPASASRKRSKELTTEDFSGVDDGNENLYQARLKNWVQRRQEARHNAISHRHDHADEPASPSEHPIHSATDEDTTQTEEWHMPHPTIPDSEFDGGYRIPGDIYRSLFDYQKTGVQWLWELFSQQVGGIVGDEMGLGKTIQIISFLAGLHYSRKMTKPVIVVAPATVMKQWVNEFHRWWPPFRVSILHTSGSGMLDLKEENRREDALLDQTWDRSRTKVKSKGHRAAQRIVKRVVEEGHILVTTYTGVQTYSDLLIPVDWEYAVLDEGHRIKNPNAAITIYCKELRTSNRVILSGTPMQNNLSELWSLFDFIFPMRLGTLVNFRNQFEFPIRQGGYANASNLQVQTAQKCAEMLKDTISPYLLQRYKIDVAADLPKKSEQVLFCKLTKLQRAAYEAFLGSEEMKAIINGKRQVLYGVDILRKICNHPDLQDHKLLSHKPGYKYGSASKSGKMQVVKALLELWKDNGHKTLLFAQHRIVLDILEKFIGSLEGMNYLRMDGNTPINARQGMVDKFNNTPDIHVFLLTTKVGGLGVNLTGANRVIIFDPDWNPSTDVQARERAWRLGQQREVMIYRLMTAGTIEEKIYHRQIFKQILTNKILRDPKQRQTFQMKDLHDLFSFGSSEDGTETGRLFQGTEVQFGTPEKSSKSATPDANSSDTGSPKPDDSVRIQELAGVSSMEQWQGAEDDGEASKADKEARIMEGLFARSGVHTALEHDQIINGKLKVVADPKIIEREAKRLAGQAAAELKRAGEAAKAVPIGTPTWTGQFGTAGRPDTAAQFRRGAARTGPSSAGILAGLQARQGAPGSGHSSRASTPGFSRGTSTPRGVDFMKMIRDYLLSHGGEVRTQMLVDHFNRYCTTTERTAQFTAMLKAIATLDKSGRGRGRGRWVLKEEYRASTSA